MKTVIILCMAVSMLLFSCTRNVDTPLEPASIDSSFQKRTIVHDLDSTVLTLTIQPTKVCFANEPESGPCNLLIDITGTLSRPVSASVRIEVERIPLVEVSNDAGTMAEEVPGPSLVLNLAPGQTRISSRTSVVINNSPEAIRDQFRLKSVTVYNPID
jgi:ABC-type Fe3+-hydroxamate transport system substrate-binding protein